MSLSKLCLGGNNDVMSKLFPLSESFLLIKVRIIIKEPGPPTAGL
jgi:hypothetical protein